MRTRNILCWKHVQKIRPDGIYSMSELGRITKCSTSKLWTALISGQLRANKASFSNHPGGGGKVPWEILGQDFLDWVVKVYKVVDNIEELYKKKAPKVTRPYHRHVQGGKIDWVAVGFAALFGASLVGTLVLILK